MKQMNRIRSITMLMTVLILGTIAGCSRSPDERLAEMAQQTMTEQIRQNQRMADQSEAIVEESCVICKTPLLKIFLLSEVLNEQSYSLDI